MAGTGNPLSFFGLPRGGGVDDETPALDAIHEIGPAGNFLQYPHTLRYYKEPFYSRLLDKGTYSMWEKNGRLTLEDKADREVGRILETHTAEPLPATVREAIASIVRREQAWIDNQ